MTNPGNRTELKVAAILRDFGYLIGWRRHEPGPGDLLAIRPPSLEADGSVAEWYPALIEVKGTVDPPWRGKWGPDERRALVQVAAEFDAEPLLAWWPPKLGGPIWLPVEDWPK